MSVLEAAARMTRVLREPSAALALGAAEWNDLLPRLRKSRLLGRFAVRAARAGIAEGLPPKIRQHIEAAMVLTESTHASLRWEVGEVQRALAPLGIPVLLLKGAAYVMAELPAAAGRASNDLDILVPKASLDDVIEALRVAGWDEASMPEGEREHFLQWLHQAPAMHHTLRQSAVDIHHAITPEAGRIHVASTALIAAARPLALPNMHVLCREDMVILAAVHWARSSGMSGGIRDFLDIDELMRDFGRDPDFHEKLTDRARMLGATRPTLEALALAQHFFATPGPVMPLPRALARLALLAGVPAATDVPTRSQMAARRLLTWRANSMQMPISLMLRRTLTSRWAGLKGMLGLNRGSDD